MHVILHHDPSAPLVVTSVMYHVGSKDEDANKTGFAHFFEHLLFEGTANIKRGDWFKIVSSNGGKNNANTSLCTAKYNGEKHCKYIYLQQKISDKSIVNISLFTAILSV